MARFYEHFNHTVDQDLIDFIHNEVFYESRYVFVQTALGIQRGFCSSCKRDFMISRDKKLKHNELWDCPKCDSPVTIKSTGRGRKNLFTDAYVVWYHKSAINPDAIVARGLHVSRSFEDYRKPETNFSEVSLYLFEPGHSEMRSLNWRGEWLKPKNIRTEITGKMQHKRSWVSRDNIKETVKGTPYQYSTWDWYDGVWDRKDCVHFFELASKYDCIEYLTKLGFYDCVKAKLVGTRTYGVINWNGKTLEKVIRLSKMELKQMKQERVVASPETLDAYHKFKKHGVEASFTLSQEVGKSFFLDEALKLNVPLAEITKYVLKQLNKEVYMARNPFRSSALYSVLVDLRDYWGEAIELGLDLSKDSIRWPNDLQKAHEASSRRIKIKLDVKVNRQIIKRLPDLDKRSFTWGDLHVRPVSSSIELFDEGKKLKHCVGQYAQKYADGESDLYVIRKNGEADEPFYTLEIQKNQVAQCRGFRNKNMTKDVAAFVEAFKEAKLSKRKKMTA